MPIRLKRAYDPPAARDGHRVLVDRIWPRGVSKDKARIDQWCREIAPDSQLRKWFGHDPAKWNEFKRRYFRELQRHDGPVQELARKARGKTLTLVFGAKDEEHNNAVALKEYLERRL